MCDHPCPTRLVSSTACIHHPSLTLSAIAFGAAVTHGNLVMLPLISRGTMEAIFAGNGPPIETFVDALQPGSGQQDLRLTSPRLTGAALVVEGRAVHVSAFAQQRAETAHGLARSADGGQ